MPSRKIVAYVPNWIDLDAFAPRIDYARLTHINLAFENPDDAGDLTFAPKNRVLIEQARRHKVKVLVSIGGGSAAEDPVLQPRYFRLIADDRRADFVRRLTDYIARHRFDGLDLDLEGPSINGDYGKLVETLGSALKAKGKLFTAALSQGYGGAKVPASALARFDFVNIMAYDGAGPWNPNAPGQHSSLEFAKGNAAYWLQRGLPREKAILGVPFYGYGFGEAFRKGDYPYTELLKRFPEAQTQDQVGSTIWHNSLPTIRAKARYVVEERLGGAMIWSLDYDGTGKQSLLTALHETLAGNG